MQMLLNNGVVINGAPVMSERARKYLSQFWSFPSKEEIEKEKEKYYVFDYKGEWTNKREENVNDELEILI
ncbi:MAG: hypothetical protein WA064_05025 [Candidatus Moraniibacteriota bacterium]